MKKRKKKYFKTGSKQRYLRYYAIETRHNQLSLSLTLPFALISSLIILFSIVLTIKPITRIPAFSLPTIAFPAVSLPHPSIHLPVVTVPNISLPKIAAPTITIPKPSIPEVHFPTIVLPTIHIPPLHMPALPIVSLPRIAIPTLSFPHIPSPTIPTIGLPAIPIPHVPHISLPEYHLPTITITVPEISFPTLPDIAIPLIQIRDNLENFCTALIDRILAFYIAVWGTYISFAAFLRDGISVFLSTAVSDFWNVLTFLNPYPLVIKLIEIGQIYLHAVWDLIITVIRFLDPRPLFTAIGERFYYLSVTMGAAFHSCASYMSPYVKLLQNSVKESSAYLLKGANDLHTAAQYIAEHQS